MVVSTAAGASTFVLMLMTATTFFMLVLMAMTGLVFVFMTMTGLVFVFMTMAFFMIVLVLVFVVFRHNKTSFLIFYFSSQACKSAMSSINLTCSSEIE